MHLFVLATFEALANSQGVNKCKETHTFGKNFENLISGGIKAGLVEKSEKLLSGGGDDYLKPTSLTFRKVDTTSDIAYCSINLPNRSVPILYKIPAKDFSDSKQNFAQIFYSSKLFILQLVQANR